MPHIQALEAVGKGDVVAVVVAFLILRRGKWMTGAIIDVDRGYSPGCGAAQPLVARAAAYGRAMATAACTATPTGRPASLSKARLECSEGASEGSS